MKTLRGRMKRWIGALSDPASEVLKGSWAVEDNRVIESFRKDPENTFLVSFPRTGSHWLRMLMERYFRRPSLTRVFYYPNRNDYLALHTHDLDLTVERSRVLYLYRDPVDTLYSQLRYHREPLDPPHRIDYWADLYGRHLDKWLIRERFTIRKTVLRFEDLKTDPSQVLIRIAAHFDQVVDEERIHRVPEQVTKGEVKDKTLHDPQAVDLNAAYETGRERFRKAHGERVWGAVLQGRSGLEGFFE
jgi:hypothetical protein